jgi:medium-chain acyl-[acyl-carrier-protein] hydrolase
LIQEAAWDHAEELGYGYAPMLERGLIWALIRQKMTIGWWPSWGQTVEVKTWLRPGQGLLVTRDLDFCSQGQRFCQATAQYLMLDQHLRHPRPSPISDSDCYHAERGPHDPERIAARVGLHSLCRFPIRSSDLDMHGHVNNTRIGQWLFDAVPAQAHQEQCIEGYEVDFQAEMRASETIQVETLPLGDGKWHFQGRREEDDKVVFTARVSTRNV